MPDHPYKVSWFIKHRKEIYDFIKKQIREKIQHNFGVKAINITAPVKSGKRTMVECFASIIHKYNLHFINIYITSLHTRDTESQRKELKKYGIEVFSLNNNTKIKDCKSYIDGVLHNGNKIIMHWDEADYGSGKKQLFAKIFRKYKDNNRIQFFRYSASSLEYEFANNLTSTFSKTDIEVIEKHIIEQTYNPPQWVPETEKGYWGYSHYLDYNKFEQSTPFFIYEDSGNTIVFPKNSMTLVKKLIYSAKRNEIKSTFRGKQTIHAANFEEAYPFICVLRLTRRNELKDFKDLQNEIIDEMNKIYDSKIKLHFIGVNDHTFGWDNIESWKQVGNDSTKATILVIQYAAKRSTEWHKDSRSAILWYHYDAVLDKKRGNIATIQQSLFRPNVYDCKTDEDGCPQMPTIYGNKNVCKYLAGHTTLNGLIDKLEGVKLSSRSKIKKQRNSAIINTYKFPDGRDYGKWEDIPSEYTHTRQIKTYINESRIDSVTGLYHHYMTNNYKVSSVEDAKHFNRGINETTKVRIIPCYLNPEINSRDDYVFVIREYGGICNGSTLTNTSIH